MKATCTIVVIVSAFFISSLADPIFTENAFIPPAGHDWAGAKAFYFEYRDNLITKLEDRMYFSFYPSEYAKLGECVASNTISFTNALALGFSLGIPGVSQLGMKWNFWQGDESWALGVRAGTEFNTLGRSSVYPVFYSNLHALAPYLGLSYGLNIGDNQMNCAAFYRFYKQPIEYNEGQQYIHNLTVNGSFNWAISNAIALPLEIQGTYTTQRIQMRKLQYINHETMMITPLLSLQFCMDKGRLIVYGGAAAPNAFDKSLNTDFTISQAVPILGILSKY